MVTYVGPDGREVGLPKLTAALAARMDAGAAQPTAQGKWRCEWEFLRQVLPEGELESEVDGATFEEADLTRLDVLYVRVRDAYTRPAREAQAESARAALDGLDLGKLSAFADAVAAISQPRTRQGFRAV